MRRNLLYINHFGVWIDMLHLYTFDIASIDKLEKLIHRIINDMNFENPILRKE